MLTTALTAGSIGCNGGTTTITNTVEGGTTPYTYAWAGGEASQNLENVPAGSYRVSVTDANGCTAEASVEITEPEELTASVSATSPACNGGTTSASVTVSGGTTPYSYAWSNGATTDMLTGIDAGEYSVTVTDANGCTATASDEVSEPEELTSELTATDIHCNGETADITNTVEGGTTPYTYAWAGGETTQNLDGVSAGTYSVTVTDYNGCSATASVEITQPDVLTTALTAGAIGCNGGTTTITNTVEGGTESYVYHWNDNSNEQNLDNVGAGTYSVTVTDQNGCAAESNVTITEPDELTSLLSAEPILCNGEMSNITNIVEGGTEPYTYAWSNAADTQNLEGVASDTYGVTVTDANGCSVVASIEITEPEVLTTSLIAGSVLCNGGTTDITNTIEGGTLPYTIVWSNGDDTQNLTDITEGTYSVSVTDTNGCTAEASVTINEPDELSLSEVAESHVDVSGNGMSDGRVEVAAAGGVEDYQYTIDNENYQSSGTFTGLTAGQYTVVVTDANGCTASVTVVVTEPDALVVDLSADQNPLLCFGDETTLTANVIGGTEPYSYAWSDNVASVDAVVSGLAAGTYSVTVTDAHGYDASAQIEITQPTQLQASISAGAILCNGGSTDITNTIEGGTLPYTIVWSNGDDTQNLTDITEGTYSVSVTDTNGCTAEASVTINEPDELSLSEVAESHVDVSGNGMSDGRVEVAAAGGVEDYQYTIDNENYQSSGTFTGLTAGQYTVVVTDANGCTASVTVVVTEPDALVVDLSADQNPLLCFGDETTLTANVIGGTEPYSYAWSDNVTSVEAIVSGLVAGTYSVTVTDAHGYDVSAQIEITQPTLLQVSISAGAILCNGGSTDAVAIVDGGTEPYTYAWDNGEISQDLLGVTMGTYSVSVTDANGCTANASVEIAEPALLSASLSANPILCNGGTTNIINTVDGGTLPYTYVWDGGSDSQNLEGVGAETYSVTVTDLNGCSVESSIEIDEPDAVEISVVAVSPQICTTLGSIELNATGGTGTLSYTWEGGHEGSVYSDINAGSYSVTVTDANNCMASMTIAVDDNSVVPEITLVSEDITICSGGTATVMVQEVANGVEPYQYSWNGEEYGSMTDFTTPALTGELNVMLNVMDGNGCVGSTMASIAVNTPSVGMLSIDEATICDGNSAVLTVSYSGNNGDMTFEWSHGLGYDAVSDEITEAGIYSVNVIATNELNGVECIDETVLTSSVTVNSRPTATISGGDVVCADYSGYIDLTITFNGAAPFTYAWSDGTTPTQTMETSITLQVHPSESTAYTLVSLSDANCTAIDGDMTGEAYVTVNTLPLVTLMQPEDICYGTSTTIEIEQIADAAAPYSYSWNGGEFSVTDDSYVTGVLTSSLNQFTLAVRDANGCTSDEASVSVNVKPLPNTQVNSPTICAGETATLTALPENAEYAWSDGLGTEASVQVSPATQATYTVTATVNGCSNATTATVYVNTNPTVDVIAADTTITCSRPTVSATAISEDVTYRWSNGTVGATATFDEGGVYTVVVTDINTCTGEATVTINEDVEATVVVINNNSGSISLDCNHPTIYVTAEGGVSYHWSNNVEVGDNAFDQPGIYTVTVTGENGCLASESINITRPEDLTISVTYNEIACHDGTTTVVVNAEGGTPEYTGVTSYSNVSAGTYTYTVTDEGGCFASETINIENPSQLEVSASATSILCNGGTSTVTIEAVGGTAPYQGTGTQIEYAGSYSYVVTDHRGCSETVQLTITEPEELVAYTTTQDALCFGMYGAAILDVVGGVPPYSVTWQDGSTGMQNEHVSVGMPFEYSVIDNNGCHISGSVSVTQPEQLRVSLTGDDVTCFGWADGSVSATVTGGTPNYTYAWSNGSVLPQIEWLSPGNYRVTVSDSHACTAESSMIINEPQQLTVRLYPTDVQCGYMLGSIASTVAGGTPGYTYTWSNSQTSESISSLQAGEYSLTVMDANGCSVDVSSNIMLNGGIDANVVVAAGIICPNDATAVLEATSRQGSEPFVYSWNNGQATPSLVNVGAGTYSVTITDAWGCTGSGSATVQSPVEIVVSIATTDAHCHNTSDGTISVNVTGGTFPYTYTWNESSFEGNNVTNAHSGTYLLTVTDDRGCESHNTVTVGAPDAIIISANIENISCYGRKDGVIEVSAEGGFEPYVFSLYDGYNTITGQSTFMRLHEGGYAIIAEDVNGCRETKNVYVIEPAPLNVYIDPTDPSCRGNNDGQIDITVTGGTEPYLYGWSDRYTDQPLISALYSGDYMVSVVDANKCAFSTNVTLNESYEDCVRVPNVFTPNGDGINDIWEIENIDMFPKAHIYVYNRWGQLIFDGAGVEGWDGKLKSGKMAPAGTYMYIIYLYTGQEPYRGVVTIGY